MGYVAKGSVYLMIGLFGLLVAVGLAERGRGSYGAMVAVAGLPLGRWLLVALLLGLVGYAALSFVAAVAAPEQGRTRAGMISRAADALTGVVYAALAAGALQLLVLPSHEGGRLMEDVTRRVLGWPGGALAIGLAGAVVLAAGIGLIARAVRPRFGMPPARGRVPRWARRAARPLARVGAAARGVIFCTCGALAVQAAWTREPGEVADVGGALTALAARPAGAWIVFVLAVGCLCYGAYQLLKARYRAIVVRAAPPA
ncbi:MAG TPA: DUF1206 domain-containing protein [Gemmatimonadaceae bacterium]|nr:DUF1206 domain-containing protein [Gemmatimonadaceae bacterium]